MLVSFTIRNYSGSRSYLLANIAHTKDSGKTILPFDNESIWGIELKPGSMAFVRNVAPVLGVWSMKESLGVGVTVRLQNGRGFWLKGPGPGQLKVGRIQRWAFWLREKCEKAAIPLE
jgi:hypothetical protein